MYRPTGNLIHLRDHVHGIPIPLTDAQARIYRLCAKEVYRDAEKALRSKDKNVLRSFGRSYLILHRMPSVRQSENNLHLLSSPSACRRRTQNSHLEWICSERRTYRSTPC